MRRSKVAKRVLAVVLSLTMVMSSMTVGAEDSINEDTQTIVLEETQEKVVDSEEVQDETEAEAENESESEAKEVDDEENSEEVNSEEENSEEVDEDEISLTSEEAEDNQISVMSDDVNYAEGFTYWFNTDGPTSLEAGQVGSTPIFAGENMAAKTNKITVNGTDYYSVQGSSNPKKEGNNPNGAIPTVGAYLKVTAPADGTITIYGYPASGKPFYATKGDTAELTDGNAFCSDSNSYTVSVASGEDWYFYAQGSKAQFVGVVFELPKAKRDVALTVNGNLGDAKISFKNKTTGDVVEVSKNDSSVSLTEGYKYEVAIDSAVLTIDVEELDLTGDKSSLTINVEQALKHKVSGEIKGLCDGAKVTKLVFEDEAGAKTEATVNGLKYEASLKNGKYTTSAEVTSADGYTIYDHVEVAGTQGEDIENDVWFYAPAKQYSSEYKSEIKVGKNEEYNTITEAIAAVKAMTRSNSEYVTLVLCDKEYVEQVIVDAANIKLVAADGVSPVIRWYYGIGYKYYSIDSTGYYNEKNANDKYEMRYAQRWGATVRVKAEGFKAEGINFLNTFNVYVCDEELNDSVVGNAAEYGQSMSGSLEERVKGLDVANGKNVERAAAMAIDAANAEFYKCSFVSSQDTLYTGSANSYFNECNIAGQTDYIFGNTGCKAIFDNCKLEWLGYTKDSKAGYITATRGDYLFRGCTITSNSDSGYTVTSGYFGRPWGNTPKVYFIGTTIEKNAICAEGWYSMSGVTPEQVTFREFGNTVDGENFYTTYSKAEDSAFRLTLSEASKLADPANDSVFLGSWTPENHISNALDLSKVESWNTAAGSSEDDKKSTNDFVLEGSALSAFAAGAKADGDSEKAGTDNYFEIIYSAKSKVDSSSKTFEDGYTSSQRINLGGAASTEKNAVKFTTSNSATVKLWWVEGGDDNRQMAILKADGSQAAITDGTFTKNSAYISTFTLDAAGTYYLGGATNNNYIFKVEVIEDQTQVNEYTLETKELTAFAAGAKADGDSEKAGTDSFFSIIYSAKSKVDSSSKTFEDDYTSSQRINFGGAASTDKNAIKFTTQGSATVKVWWAEGGDDNRQMAILKADGTQAAVTDGTFIKNSAYISTFTLDTAGTYYLGGATNNNYIFKVYVEDVVGGKKEVVRKSWSEVTAPVIKSAEQTEGNIEVTVAMVIGNDGADAVVVTMTDEKGNTTSKKSSKEGSEVTLSFTPSASGKYTFDVEATRDKEETTLKSEKSKTVDFILPLGKANIKSVASKGNGTVEVAWDAVDEATSYIVTVDGKEYKETKELVLILDGLTVGQTYTFGVKAVRNETEVAESGITKKHTVVDEVQRTWAFSAFGQGVNTSDNGYTGSISDGSVTVYSESGKGKIVPASNDGLAFYYTAIDAENENFTLTAKVHVDKWTFSNGQEGFGIMACDAVAANGYGTNFWNNSYQALASKIEYYYDSATDAITADTNATKVTMKLGLGYNVRTGVTKADEESFNSKGVFTYANGSTGSLPENFVATSGTLETYGAKDANIRNIVGNATATVEKTMDNALTDFVLQIQRNNTGYYLRYLDNDGNVINEKKFYDLERVSLTKIDKDNIYIGFFASRNARITVSDMNLTIIDPADDEPAEEREIEYVYPVYTIESSTYANSADYDLVYYGNADAKVTIMSENGTTVCKDYEVKASTKYTFATKVSLGTNKFNITVTPNEDYVPGEYQKLTSYEAVTFSHEVNYNQFSGEYIYVSASADSKGEGTKEKPVDIYTAVKYVAAGQTIVLAAEKYSLSSTVKVDRGIDGTASAPIYMISDPDSQDRAVFDFNAKCAGMVLAGNHWYFKGFDVTNSGNGQKGIQVSGNYNTLDQVNAYMNGNTGIQISRYLGTDEYAQWPAYNLILNCSSYLNADAGYEDADGFAAKLTVGDGNVFDGCISAYNADDGWDLFAKAQSGSIGSVTIQNSVAFKNGYVLTTTGEKYAQLSLTGKETDAGNGNGFKMGGDSMPGAHVLKNSVAFANKAKGIDSNSCPDIKVYQSTSFDNEGANVAFYTNTAVNTNYFANGILSYKVSNDTVENIKMKGTQSESAIYGDTNYYTTAKKTSANKSGQAVQESWFESLNLDASKGVYGILRNSDGSINMNSFLVLTGEAPEGVGARINGNTVLAEEAGATSSKNENSDSTNTNGGTTNGSTSSSTSSDSSSSSSSSESSATAVAVSVNNNSLIAADVDFESVNGLETVVYKVEGSYILRMKLFEQYHSRSIQALVNLPGGVGVSFMTNEAPIGAKDIDLEYVKYELPDFANGFDTYKYVFKNKKQLEFTLGFHMNLGKEFVGKAAYIFVLDTKTNQLVLKKSMLVNEIGNVATYIDELSEVWVLIAK